MNKVRSWWERKVRQSAKEDTFWMKSYVFWPLMVMIIFIILNIGFPEKIIRPASQREIDVMKANARTFKAMEYLGYKSLDTDPPDPGVVTRLTERVQELEKQLNKQVSHK